MTKSQIRRFVNSKVFALAIAICVLGLIYLKGKYDSKKFRKEILSNSITVIGTVKAVESKIKLGVVINYQFEFEYRSYFAETTSSAYASVKHLLVGRHFPVILDSKSPDKNHILILPKDFKAFNMKFPDSLSWLVQTSK